VQSSRYSPSPARHRSRVTCHFPRIRLTKFESGFIHRSCTRPFPYSILNYPSSLPRRSLGERGSRHSSPPLFDRGGKCKIVNAQNPSKENSEKQGVLWRRQLITRLPRRTLGVGYHTSHVAYGRTAAAVTSLSQRLQPPRMNLKYGCRPTKFESRFIFRICGLAETASTSLRSTSILHPALLLAAILEGEWSRVVALRIGCRESKSSS
jgi:hypothetical protein